MKHNLRLWFFAWLMKMWKIELHQQVFFEGKWHDWKMSYDNITITIIN